MKVEVDRVKLPVSVTILGKIADTMGPGVTMRQAGEWLVFEREEDNAKSLVGKTGGDS